MMSFIPFLVSVSLFLTTSVNANETDRLSLLAFKSMILHDPLSIMSLWNDSLHLCQWEGVICGSRNRVISLNLRSKSLGGSLSPHIGNLSFLGQLNLQNNTLSGQIPPHLGHLSRLQNLTLAGNAFQGEIPANISHCSNLIYLALDYNQLIGEIPPELGYLSKLKYLSLQSNNLTGNIPPSIGNLTSLESLAIVSNSLVGNIPSSLGQLKNLRQLYLGANNLSGVIPPSVYNLSLLNIFSLASNQLEGTLPQDIGFTLPHLQFINLGFNQFTGTLPRSLSNATELERIAIPSNNLTGKISVDFASLKNFWGLVLWSNNFGSGEPDEFDFITSLANCRNLQVMAVEYNQLKGVLPDFVGNFSAQLFYFAVAGNHIHGIIPLWLGGLGSLTQLFLHENEFTGNIPGNIGNLRKVQQLALYSNKLTGEIPSSFGNLSLLLELYLDDNRLEGKIPSSLGNCQKLLMFDLSRNNLSGLIPPEILGISSLSRLLNLSQNSLSGPLPSSVGDLVNLGILDVSENHLSDKLPSSLDGCASLEELYLNGNFLQGSVPQSFSSLRGLQILFLSHNNLSGNFPEFLGSLSLSSLNLSYNHFEGEVPTRGAFANASSFSVIGNDGLCGGITELQLPKCTANASNGRKISRIGVILIILSVLLCVILVSSFLWCFFRKKQKAQCTESICKESFLNVSYDMLLKATDGFSSANLIGSGAFGSVYKGILGEDKQTVAVKVINVAKQGGLQSFVSECEALRNIRHRNLVKIITACSSTDFQGNDFKALVYEFMPNGSVEGWLHSSKETEDCESGPRSLNLLQRIEIAIDVASALDYLHHSSGRPIVHCDLKPSNILLDAEMVAHVADFGLAKFLLRDSAEANQSSSIGVRGTVGYAAPEYGLGSEVSPKGDVYSYGIFLLEMMTGRRPTDPMFEEGLNLHGYADISLMDSDSDSAKDIIDTILLMDDEGEKNVAANSSSKSKECLVTMIKLGVSCSMDSPNDRMDISSVLRELHLLI